MDKKLNPLDGEIDLLGDTVSDIIRKLNPLTGRLELVYSADSYIQKINPFIGDFDMVGGTGASYIVKEATGSGYINLTNAVANRLMELKVYGGTEQNGTPTPNTPVDIVCNNGVLKLIHQSGLPIGYTLLDYIKSGGNNYIDTGIKLTNEDVVEIQYLQTADKGAIYGEYYNGTSNMSTTLYGNGKFYFYAYNAGGTATNVGTYDTNVHTVVHNFVDGYIDFDGVRTNFDLPNPNSFTNILNCPIFGRSNSSSIGYFSKTQLYYFRIRRNGTLILDLIPAKDSNDTVGMYDRVSGTLFTESGSGSFTAGNTVADPMTVYADGTTETIRSHSKNLFDRAATTVGLRLNDDGTTAPINIMFVSQFISVKPNTTYTLSYISGELNQYRRICGYNDETSESFTGLIKKMNRNNGGGVGEYITTSFTTDANTNYIIVSAFNTDTNIQLEQGDTATEYQPYYDGGTATAEMLLKVGDYQDEQEILSGAVTRNIGIKVLDGTEDWEPTSTVGLWLLHNVEETVLPSTCICTHFLGVSTTTSGLNMPDLSIRYGVTGYDNRLYIRHNSLSGVADLKQFLANQYAAGTPVIVVYPLATPATESVAGQTMHIPSGDSTIGVLQTSIDNLGLYAKYKATV